MSDFDAVLERLLSEPSFAAALAADPDAALSGYRLDAGEVELLRSQASSDSGGGLAAVETRTNKSSTFGLFSAFAGIGHALSAEPAGGAVLGPGAAVGSAAGAAAQHVADAAVPGSVFGSAAGATAQHVADAAVPGSVFGSAAGATAQHVADAVGTHGATQGLGAAPDAWGSGGGSAYGQWPPSEHSGLGSAPDGGGAPVSGFGDAPQSGFGDAPHSGFGDSGRSGGDTEYLPPPKGYHPHIDANGDGHWDKATFIGTKGHGVEILVDVNHDGHVDFVGHDTNSDGLVDYADYDKNDDGIFEKRMYDDNGDGWLDRTVWYKKD